MQYLLIAGLVYVSIAGVIAGLMGRCQSLQGGSVNAGAHQVVLWLFADRETVRYMPQNRFFVPFRSAVAVLMVAAAGLFIFGLLEIRGKSTDLVLAVVLAVLCVLAYGLCRVRGGLKRGWLCSLELMGYGVRSALWMFALSGLTGAFVLSLVMGIVRAKTS